MNTYMILHKASDQSYTSVINRYNLWNQIKGVAVSVAALLLLAAAKV